MVSNMHNASYRPPTLAPKGDAIEAAGMLNGAADPAGLNAPTAGQ